MKRTIFEKNNALNYKKAHSEKNTLSYIGHFFFFQKFLNNAIYNSTFTLILKFLDFL